VIDTLGEHRLLIDGQLVVLAESGADVVAIANDSTYGLSGGVSAASNKRALAVARRIRATALPTG
jgi:acyl-CoA reductase-like NAD-dependent aldehyde dehydrogenase